MFVTLCGVDAFLFVESAWCITIGLVMALGELYHSNHTAL
jgi:hypothetical protein